VFVKVGEAFLFVLAIGSGCQNRIFGGDDGAVKRNAPSIVGIAELRRIELIGQRFQVWSSKGRAFGGLTGRLKSKQNDWFAIGYHRERARRKTSSLVTSCRDGVRFALKKFGELK
jgi:hypothetical protein